MNDEELRSTIEQIKAQVKAKPENKDKTEDEIDEMILDAFFQAYTEGKITKDDLGGLAESMGYEFAEDFEQDPAAAQELGGGENEPLGPGATKEDLEAVRTMEPGESAENFQEKVEDVREGEHVANQEEEDAESSYSEDEEAEEGEDEEDDEETERRKASELWKMNLNK